MFKEKKKTIINQSNEISLEQWSAIINKDTLKRSSKCQMCKDIVDGHGPASRVEERKVN